MTNISLFQFMPYGAPELKEVARRYMVRAVGVEPTKTPASQTGRDAKLRTRALLVGRLGFEPRNCLFLRQVLCRLA